MVFSQQVTSDKQDSAHDSYRMPQSLYIRLACTKEVSQAAFGKDECSVWELFGVIKDALDDLRCKIGTNGAQEIEIYNHGAGLAYAYVPVEKNEHKGEFSLHTLEIPLISSDDSISPFDNRIVCLKYKSDCNIQIGCKTRSTGYSSPRSTLKIFSGISLPILTLFFIQRFFIAPLS